MGFWYDMVYIGPPRRWQAVGVSLRNTRSIHGRTKGKRRSLLGRVVKQGEEKGGKKKKGGGEDSRKGSRKIGLAGKGAYHASLEPEFNPEHT